MQRIAQVWTSLNFSVFTNGQREDISDALVESGIGAVSVEETLVAVAALVLDVPHLVVHGDEVLGSDSGT